MLRGTSLCCAVITGCPPCGSVATPVTAGLRGCPQCPPAPVTAQALPLSPRVSFGGRAGFPWWRGVPQGCVLGPEQSTGCRARGDARILGQPFCLQHQPCSQCLPAAVLSKQECARAEPGHCPTVPTAHSGSGRSRAGAPQGSAGTGCSCVPPVWTGAQESFQAPNSEVFFRCCGIWSLQVE